MQPDNRTDVSWRTLNAQNAQAKLASLSVGQRHARTAWRLALLALMSLMLTTGPSLAATADRATAGQNVALKSAASNDKQAEANHPQQAHAPAPTFLVGHTQLRMERPAVLTFQLSQAATADQNFKATIEPAGVVEVMREPAVLAGYDIGYLQVRPVKQGRCVLTVGQSKIELHVLPALAQGILKNAARPLIVTPSRGSAVWGTFTVSVEVNDLEQFDQPTNDESNAAHVQLELAGKRLEPIASPQVVGPMRRYLFDVDVSQQPAGVIELTAVSTKGADQTVRSEVLRLLCVKPGSEHPVIAQECEATLDTPRDKNIGMERPSVGRDPAASGKKYVSSYSLNPVWAFSIDVKNPGRYQVMLVARGDEAAGAFPSIGLAVDGEGRSTTGARLADDQWRRYAIGVPLELAAGKHVIAAKFLNDFYAEDLADRNLYLDRYEIMRVDGPSAEAPAAGGMMAKAGDGGAMMMMKSSPSMMAKAAPTMQMMTMKMTASPARMTDAASKPLGGKDIGEVPNSMSMMGLYQDKADAMTRVSFTRPLNELQVRGDVTLRGVAWWPEPRKNDVPRTTLLINGKPFDSQWAQDPLFHISSGYFKPGLNSVQLLTELKEGGSGISPVQALFVPKEVAAEGYTRKFMRFAVSDPAWVSLPNGLSSPQYPQGAREARFHTFSEAVLQLPADLTGSFDVVTEINGDEFQGRPIAQVSLRIKNKPTDTPDKIIGQAEAYKWTGERRIGRVDLPAGEKQLVVKFINDAYEENKGDRNLALRALSLRQPAPTKEQDAVPPALELLYPADGQDTFDADAVVANAWDNDSLAWVDLVIDGKTQKAYADLSDGMGKLVFPLLLRSLSPGEHRIKLRARDRAQNMAESKEVVINVLAEAPAKMTRYARAVRLVNRFAYGPDQEELAAVLTMGEQAWLSERLSRSGDDLAQQAVLEQARAVYPSEGDYGSIGQRVIHELIHTANPVRTRFVLWTENHFSTWIRKTEADRKWEEHQRFEQLGAAPFSELLLVSATSPAMLIYLDQARSFAGSLNENYAREIMELHTLGVHAGYTQADIIALANVLCGWTFSEETAPDGTTFPLYPSFRFDPGLGDGQPRQVFGLAFPAAAPDKRLARVQLALQMLAAHPAAARFIATKLIEHYVAIPAPKTMVDDLTNVYLTTGGDMKAMLLAIASHPDFWRTDMPTKIARPIDYVARLFRTTNADDTWQAYLFLERSGMGMFDYITPDGYPEADDHYADTNALLQRWRLAQNQRWRLSTVVPYSWQQPAKADPAQWRQNVVDLIAVRLTGFPLSKASNQAALNVLEQARGSGDEIMQQLAPFIASLPEASLR